MVSISAQTRTGLQSSIAGMITVPPPLYGTPIATTLSLDHNLVQPFIVCLHLSGAGDVYLQTMRLPGAILLQCMHSSLSSLGDIFMHVVRVFMRKEHAFVKISFSGCRRYCTVQNAYELRFQYELQCET